MRTMDWCELSQALWDLWIQIVERCDCILQMQLPLQMDRHLQIQQSHRQVSEMRQSHGDG